MGRPTELDPEKYIVSKPLAEVLLALEITGRPLLIKGEPGTGKTMLAEYLAFEKKSKLFKWHVKSSTNAKDGLYFYDALSRLNDARFQNEANKETSIHNIENYIRLGPLGEAFAADHKSIVLIDEIDKADIEFPNDLLLELDKMEFHISETGRTIKAKHRPYFIITSNNEKELPDAFLRRCLFYYIDFPDYESMQNIVKNHYPDIEKDLLNRALDAFFVLRQEDELKKKPSTSEFIDWIQILLHQGAKLEKNLQKDKMPFLGALIKNEEDLNLFKENSERRPRSWRSF